MNTTITLPAGIALLLIVIFFYRDNAIEIAYLTMFFCLIAVLLSAWLLGEAIIYLITQSGAWIQRKKTARADTKTDG